MALNGPSFLDLPLRISKIIALDSRIPVVVRTRVECARCGHTADETYEFDMPFAKSQPMEAYDPGKCPECGGPIEMHLKRSQQRQ